MANGGKSLATTSMWIQLHGDCLWHVACGRLKLQLQLQYWVYKWNRCMQKLRNGIGNGHALVFYANSIVSCCIANGRHCSYGAHFSRPSRQDFTSPNAKFKQTDDGYRSPPTYDMQICMSSTWRIRTFNNGLQMHKTSIELCTQAQVK